MKSFTFRMGGALLPSQFASGSPAANRPWKQMKSFTFKTGGELDASQFA
jgi:hypothetical protein